MDTDSINEIHSDAEVLDDEVDDEANDPTYKAPRGDRQRTGGSVKTTPSERIKIKQERSTPRGQKKKVDLAAQAVCLVERVSRSSVIEYCHVIGKKELDAAVIGHFSILFSQLTFISSTIWSIIGACLDIR